jgi:hypothetical protein
MYIEGEDKIEKSSTENGITVRVCVVKVENGYICQKSISGHRGEGEKREYFDDQKTYITTKNPFEGDQENIKLPNIRGILDTTVGAGKLKL